LMFLADALHHFARIGDAIQDGNPAHIVAASDGVLQAFAGYDTERPEWGQRQPKPTFDVWARMVPPANARGAMTGIRNKATAMIAD